ncbi:MAG: oligosaccharide flippase family protein, partial [Nitrososphaera sp.]|nr:oligosaccharide flippase family protein [Nitrososphaera sp.]
MTDESSKFRRSVVSGFAWQGATNLFGQVITWACTIFVARILDPSDYGIMAVANVMTGILMLANMGFTQALIQKEQLTQQEEDGIFVLGLAINAVAYLVLYLLAPVLATFYQMELLTDVVRVAGLALLLGSIRAVPYATVMRNMDFRYRSLVEVGANLTSAVAVVALALKGFGVWSLIAGFVVTNLVSTAAFLPSFRRIPSLRFSVSAVADLFAFSMKVTANSLLSFIYRRADV